VYNSVNSKLKENLKSLDEKLETKAPVREIMTADRAVKRLTLMVDNFSRNPKEIPRETLIAMLNTPPGVPDAVERKLRKRIRNRSTAIRSFCIMCMGCQPKAVKECSATWCPLWPFRMGGDPLRPSRIVNGVAEPSIDDDDTEDLDSLAEDIIDED
jgi:hypothetical protein